jgi:hypothetical protein
MAHKLGTVACTHFIRNVGLIVSGLDPECPIRVYAGTSIVLKRPDGSVVTSRIQGLALVSPRLCELIDFLLKDVGQDDVPVGTEIWSVDDPS